MVPLSNAIKGIASRLSVHVPLRLQPAPYIGCFSSRDLSIQVHSNLIDRQPEVASVIERFRGYVIMHGWTNRWYTRRTYKYINLLNANESDFDAPPSTLLGQTSPSASARPTIFECALLFRSSSIHDVSRSEDHGSERSSSGLRHHRPVTVSGASVSISCCASRRCPPDHCCADGVPSCGGVAHRRRSAAAAGSRWLFDGDCCAGDVGFEMSWRAGRPTGMDVTWIPGQRIKVRKRIVGCRGWGSEAFSTMDAQVTQLRSFCDEKKLIFRERHIVTEINEFALRNRFLFVSPYCSRLSLRADTDVKWIKPNV